MQPTVSAFFDEATYTISYVVAEPDGPHCAIVDSVMGFDAKAGRTFTEPADRLVDHVREHGLTVDWILESHCHADHLTAAPYLKDRVGGKTGISGGIRQVQQTFARIYNVEGALATDGSQFDHLFEDGESFDIGAMPVTALATPGHTPSCMVYHAGDAAFVGDTLFMPDFGTARCDFPGGDARLLYRSIKRVLALPPETRLFMCHDYGPGGRDIAWETSVAVERRDNIHVNDQVSEDEYVAMRSERDATLSMPALLLPSIQVNIRAGHLPDPEDNGIAYLKLPLNAF